ncbi:glucose/arabinose dehydrogenase/cytochrome c5 [Pelomonas saccharophila]|uniref:Glucose/arabinose dehydrogenase/cytochrome c5 n=1 Tax=Roseateles saccharophilus TaxID=304 RepID=A0ABU1YUC8_ROSSA|nr:c-type cytochrome [Roseateles saccharophilus]MDR7272472.1 glucose/arabinose dehydrogenase/cytochrome c5 [Roseateles saccharophilus]
MRATGLGLWALLGAGIGQAAAAADGSSVYAQNCLQCHGANREGGIGPNLTGAHWNRVRPNPQSLARFIAQGSTDGRMPGWSKRLTPQQIGAVADYLLKPPPASDGDHALRASAEPYPELKDFRLPPGFSIAVYSDKVPSARGMAVAESGIVYVASRTAGKVFALVDGGRQVVTVASGLDAPIGVTLLNGALFVSERFRVLRLDDIAHSYDRSPPLHVVKDDFPKDAWHGEKIIKAGPDGKLYVPIGAPCNSCDRENEPHAKIHRMNPDGSQFEVYARGVRNSVGFGWHPLTREFWFTDNGRDMLGDNMPSDKLNHAPRPGMHFGFPYCQGGVLPDPEFHAGRQCSEFTEPAAKLGPHVASLGLHFYTGQQFPEAYRNQLFIAEHGSWNRSQKIGYRVALITLYGDKVVSDTVFVEGFLQREKVVGRPVDIAQLPDGSMLISDDFAGRIYRVSYQAPAVTAAVPKPPAPATSR